VITRSKPNGRGVIKSNIKLKLITINEQYTKGTKIFEKYIFPNVIKFIFDLKSNNKQKASDKKLFLQLVQYLKELNAHLPISSHLFYAKLKNKFEVELAANERKKKSNRTETGN